MNNKRPNIQGSNQSNTPERMFDSDPLFERLDDLNHEDHGGDLVGLFKSINSFREAKDDRALENMIKQRFSSKVFVLENMAQSDFYNRKNTTARSLPSRNCMGQGDKESRGLNDLSKLTYSDADRLNRMWIAYASAFLQVLDRMVSAPQVSETTDPVQYIQDFINHHFELTGATIEVAHSQNSQLIGIMGIVIRENENSFELISASNKRRLIPKDVTTIRVHVSGHPGLILRGPELAGIGRTGSLYRASTRIQNRNKRNSLSYS